MMSPRQVVRLLNRLSIKPYTNYIMYQNGFHTTHQLCLDQSWRQQKGLSENPNSYGILTNGADYSYKDGKPTPYGTGQRKRIDTQRQYVAKMIQLSKQIDGAIAKHAKLQKDEQAAAQSLLDKRLKPKGQLYKPLSKTD